MGIDILGIDIVEVDILGIDIPAPTRSELMLHCYVYSTLNKSSMSMNDRKKKGMVISFNNHTLLLGKPPDVQEADCKF